MATQTSIFKRFFNSKKKNSDWARVEEPDRFDMVSLSIVGIVLTAFLMMLAQFMMTNNIVELIARYLASFDVPLTFNERLAVLGMGLIVFINLLITLIFVFFAPVSNDDIVEMLSDLDANFQERLVEHEASTTEHLNRIAQD